MLSDEQYAKLLAQAIAYCFPDDARSMLVPQNHKRYILWWIYTNPCCWHHQCHGRRIGVGPSYPALCPHCYAACVWPEEPTRENTFSTGETLRPVGGFNADDGAPPQAEYADECGIGPMWYYNTWWPQPHLSETRFGILS